jgi:hypothetical protein
MFLRKRNWAPHTITKHVVSMVLLDELEARLGKYDDSAMKRVMASSRIGRSGRCYHNRVASITRKNGGARKAAGTLDYDARKGTHEKRADELELEGGLSREDMREALKAIEAANPRKNGKVAGRGEIELPQEMNAAMRAEVAQGIAAYFEQHGYPVHWAVHDLNEHKQFQPHFHWTACARRAWKTKAGWQAEGTKGKPLLDGPAEMSAWRRHVADAINAVAMHHGLKTVGMDRWVPWSPGRLEDTGIDRPAKRRRPMVAVKAPERATGDDRGLAETNRLIDEGQHEEVRRRRREWSRAEIRARQVERKLKEGNRRAREPAMVERLDTGKGMVPAELAKLIFDQLRLDLEAEATAAAEARGVAEQSLDLATKLQATIETERAREDRRPPTDKQLTSCRERAERLGVELPEGWDGTVGSAGVAMRLLATLEARQRAAEGLLATEQGKRAAAEQRALEEHAKGLHLVKLARPVNEQLKALKENHVDGRLLDKAYLALAAKRDAAGHDSVMQALGALYRVLGRPAPASAPAAIQQPAKGQDQGQGGRGS